MAKIIVQFCNSKGRFISQQKGWAAIHAAGKTDWMSKKLNEMEELLKDVPMRNVFRIVCK